MPAAATLHLAHPQCLRHEAATAGDGQGPSGAGCRLPGTGGAPRQRRGRRLKPGRAQTAWPSGARDLIAIHCGGSGQSLSMTTFKSVRRLGGRGRLVRPLEPQGSAVWQGDGHQACRWVDRVRVARRGHGVACGVQIKPVQAGDVGHKVVKFGEVDPGAIRGSLAEPAACLQDFLRSQLAVGADCTWMPPSRQSPSLFSRNGPAARTGEKRSTRALGRVTRCGSCCLN